MITSSSPAPSPASVANSSPVSSASRPRHAAPAGLLCDLLAHPERTRIATTAPTFGWIVNGGESGPAQAAYQVRVREHSGSTVWDSGCVASAQSVNVEFAGGGGGLRRGGRYAWQVRTWADGAAMDESEASPWSEEQVFAVAGDAGEAIGANGARELMSVYPLETVRVPPARLERDLSRVVAGASDGWTVDFGRQAFGWLELEIEYTGGGGGEIVLAVRLGEAARGGVLDRMPPGSVRYAESSLRVRAGRHTYRVQTEADERNSTRPAAIKLPEALGVVLPFRFAEVEVPRELPSAAVMLHAATLVRVQYPFNEYAASFRSSSPELDRVWELCRYSIQATSFAGYYVDGDRERIPYEADAYINQLCHYAVDREFSLARRTHEYLLSHPTWPTEWKQHSILVAWADYEATGDARSLKRHYACLRDEKLLLQHARADGLLATGCLRDVEPKRTDVGDLVDWPPGERDGFDFRDVNTVINAFHYRTLVVMAKIARAAGHDADAVEFERRAEVVRVRFNEVFFDRTRGVYVDGEGSDHVSIHGNLFALAFGLASEGGGGRHDGRAWRLT
ncbi:alpha-L-rhamnosidase [Geminisphaera colitermitum]|uniref:alpha-L-rhamnosidase-related protein n=1 Tax=Geminisphaera colitermitum TaxID=1148786 RepID=UPI0022B7DFCA|nr:alpha-L-rhamnosidase [Geminisphaera colitermitum]